MLAGRSKSEPATTGAASQREKREECFFMGEMSGKEQKVSQNQGLNVGGAIDTLSWRRSGRIEQNEVKGC